MWSFTWQPVTWGVCKVVIITSAPPSIAGGLIIVVNRGQSSRLVPSWWLPLLLVRALSPRWPVILGLLLGCSTRHLVRWCHGQIKLAKVR